MMKSQQPLFLFLAGIPVLALIAGISNSAGVKTHFYVWELLFDGKTLLLVLLFFFLALPGVQRSREWKRQAQERGVFRWSLWTAAGAFLIPALITGGVVGAGLLLKTVRFAAPENGATLLLTIVFDIPAVFIFSITTVFVEEYIFRGFVLTEFLKAGRPVAGLVLSSTAWALYAIVEVLPLDEFSWPVAAVLIFSYIAIGVGASALYRASGSLWVSYAFRIGVLTLTPSLLSGVTGVTDAFFSTENFLFYGDGVIASCAVLGLFLSVFFRAPRNRENSKNSAPA